MSRKKFVPTRPKFCLRLSIGDNEWCTMHYSYEKARNALAFIAIGASFEISNIDTGRTYAMGSVYANMLKTFEGVINVNVEPV